MKKIAILGCGNMTQAIFLPLDLKKSQLQAYTYTPSFVKAEDLADVLEGTAVRKISDLPQCDYYFIGCKPQQFRDLATELRTALPKEFKVISIMAGIQAKTIRDLLPGCKNVMRVMPNTPALVGHGAFTSYFAGESWDEKDKQRLSELFLGVGEVFEVLKEEDLDFLTPINGSAPAYIFEIAHIFEKIMMEKGFSQKFSQKLIAQTFVGAGVLLKNSDDSAQVLRNNVTSKGGVTEAALKVMSEKKVDEILSEALLMARKRNSELSTIC